MKESESYEFVQKIGTTLRRKKPCIETELQARRLNIMEGGQTKSANKTSNKNVGTKVEFDLTANIS
jgi:hypothetical protein